MEPLQQVSALHKTQIGTLEMDDEDGTCLLDVLCDPQALNDFLHGTNELPSGDLLINPSSGEPPLFTDTPSPVSLLADDVSSQGTPASGCVDLSFLDEALLASPASSLGNACSEDRPNIQMVKQHKESEEICDILQQSLQEADITEDTLALEAGLGLSDASLPLPATPYLSKPLTIPGLISLPKDTQTAVEPPQPSLLAVGPGCPSLKPPGTQLMSLLPGNVFPTPSLEASFSINSAQSTSMIIQKTLPSRQMLTSTVRTITPSGVMLQKTPLPIQPKLPVNIQPRLVQISPRPSSQKPLPGIAFISANASQSVLISPSVTSKQSLQAQSAPGVSSFNLVGQGGPIVIQPQDPFQGQRQFFVPSQGPATFTQSTSIPRCLISTPTNQVSNKPSTSHILTVRPRQISFSPIFSPQLTLKQGSLLSGCVPIRSTPPTVFQMPTQLAGTFVSQVQGQHDAVVGNQIALMNNGSMLFPDMTPMQIANGQSVVQSAPVVPSAQRTLVGGPEGKVLLLHERTSEDEEKVNKPLQENRLFSLASVDVPSVEPSPVSALLQSSSDVSCAPDPVLPLSPQLITQTGRQQFAEGAHNQLHHNPQALIHLSQQYPLMQSATQESLATTLLLQMDNQVATAPCEPEDSITPLTASEMLSSLCDSEEPAYHSSEHSDISMHLLTTDTDFVMGSTAPASNEQGSSLSVALVADPKCQEEPVLSPSPSSDMMFVYQQQVGQTCVLTDLIESPQPTGQEYKQLSDQYDKERTYARNNSGIVPSDQHESQGVVNLGARLHAQDEETYSALQKKTQTTGMCPKEEKLTQAKRQHRIKQQLFMDHSAVLNPNTSAPFVSVEDAVRHLLPYHTCARALPSQADFISVDEQFECFSVVLLKRIKDMLNKYRQLHLAESQQESPSAEMVMLERLFLQSERLSLGEDRRRARRDQAGSFLMSQPKSSSQNNQESPAKTDHPSCPSSPPSWTLQSDRPPGLKTYRSSSKGALRLTIKQESGSPKVVHNSACDASNAISGFKRNHSGQLQGKDESLKPPSSNNEENKNEVDMQTIKKFMDGNSQSCSDSVSGPDCVTPNVEGFLQEQSTPVLKRNRLAASPAVSPGLAALVEDGELSEDLQSAIESILELQRLQGSETAVKIHQPHALDQAVSSMLEEQLRRKVVDT